MTPTLSTTVTQVPVDLRLDLIGGAQVWRLPLGVLISFPMIGVDGRARSALVLYVDGWWAPSLEREARELIEREFEDLEGRYHLEIKQALPAGVSSEEKRAEHPKSPSLQRKGRRRKR